MDIYTHLNNDTLLNLSRMRMRLRFCRARYVHATFARRTRAQACLLLDEWWRLYRRYVIIKSLFARNALSSSLFLSLVLLPSLKRDYDLRREKNGKFRSMKVTMLFATYTRVRSNLQL